MKHSSKFLIASILVGATALAACGKSGGGNSAASPGAGASFGNTPAGYIGNGTWQGRIAISNRDQFLIFAAQAGMCAYQGCTQSFVDLTVRLQSGGGYYGTYPYNTTPVANNGMMTQGAFRLGNFSRNQVYLTGGSASFTMIGGLWNQVSYGQPPVANEPQIRINGSFTDQTQSVMNVTLYYNGNAIGSGQIFNYSYGGGYGYGTTIPGYTGNPYGSYYGGGTVYLPYSNRR